MIQNDTILTLIGRRSIRTYKQEQITDEELQTILVSGTFAPSGMDSQPWRFSVVQSKELLDRINNFVKERLVNDDKADQSMIDMVKAEDFSVFYNAPTLIIVSGYNDAPTAQFDCVLAMGNMLNAAASIGVGSCWIHAVSAALNNDPDKDLIRELYIPEDYTVFCSAVFGYNAGQPPMPSPRKKRPAVVRK
jgi:nitroreductase